MRVSFCEEAPAKILGLGYPYADIGTNSTHRPTLAEMCLNPSSDQRNSMIFPTNTEGDSELPWARAEIFGLLLVPSIPHLIQPLGWLQGSDQDDAMPGF